MDAYGRFAVSAAAPALIGALALASIATAQTLPPPPYQTADQAGGATAQPAPQTMDRYGGGARRSYPAPLQAGGPAAPAPPGRYLAWSGKTEMQAPAAASAPQAGGWSAMSGRWSTQPPARPQPRQAQMQPQTPAQMQVAAMPPPTNPWRPYRPQTAQTTPTPTAAPTSIYDAPAAAPAQPYRQAQAAADPQGGPRFYSLHRDYGIQPDPIPLPPQFFGPTADLSASVAEPLARRVTTVGGQTRTVNVPDDQGTQ